jgi:hypothetical protein
MMATSVTFGTLRCARANYRKRISQLDGERHPWGRPFDDTVVLVLRHFAYAGTGWQDTPGPALALASAVRAREHDRADHPA